MLAYYMGAAAAAVVIVVAFHGYTQLCPRERFARVVEAALLLGVVGVVQILYFLKDF